METGEQGLLRACVREAWARKRLYSCTCSGAGATSVEQAWSLERRTGLRSRVIPRGRGGALGMCAVSTPELTTIYLFQNCALSSVVGDSHRFTLKKYKPIITT